MKLTARKDVTLDDDYVDIRYRELTPAIHQIFQLCEDAHSILLCEKDDATHKVDVNDVLYIEAVDRKSCVYTKDDVSGTVCPFLFLMFTVFFMADCPFQMTAGLPCRTME